MSYTIYWRPYWYRESINYNNYKKLSPSSYSVDECEIAYTKPQYGSDIIVNGLFTTFPVIGPDEYNRCFADLQDLTYQQITYETNIGELKLKGYMYFRNNGGWIEQTISSMFTINIGEGRSMINVDNSNPEVPNPSSHKGTINKYWTAKMIFDLQDVIPDFDIYDYVLTRSSKFKNITIDYLGTNESGYNFRLAWCSGSHNHFYDESITSLQDFINKYCNKMLKYTVDKVVSDRKIANHFRDLTSPEYNIAVSESYFVGTISHQCKTGYFPANTKTYTNNTWSTNKTFYIKTVFNGPNGRANSGSSTALTTGNVVNYVTIYITKAYYI